MWWTGLLNHRASSGVLEAGPSVPRTRTVGLTRVSQWCLNHLLAALLCCPAALSPFVSVTLVAEGDHNVALLRGVQQGWLTLLTELTVLAEFVATELESRFVLEGERGDVRIAAGAGHSLEDTGLQLFSRLDTAQVRERCIQGPHWPLAIGFQQLHRVQKAAGGPKPGQKTMSGDSSLSQHFGPLTGTAIDVGGRMKGARDTFSEQSFSLVLASVPCSWLCRPGTLPP